MFKSSGFKFKVVTFAILKFEQDIQWEVFSIDSIAVWALGRIFYIEYYYISLSI